MTEPLPAALEKVRRLIGNRTRREVVEETEAGKPWWLEKHEQ